MNNLLTTNVSLVTASTTNSAQYRILELTPDLIRPFESVENCKLELKRSREEEDGDLNDNNQARSGRLCIKGRHDDEAVLCTSNQTFALREMTQSNSLLLCDVQASISSYESKKKEEERNFCAVVRSNVAEIWELAPAVPRTSRLPDLLHESLYYGKSLEEEEEEEYSKRKRYTPQNVASIIQASPTELRQGLDEHHVILLDGFYRMIAPSHLSEVLQFLLNFVDSKGQDCNYVDYNEALSDLQDNHYFRKEIIESILLRWFGKAKLSGGSDQNDLHVELNVASIIRYIGLHVLEQSSSARPIRMDDFLQEWQSKVGSNLHDQIDVKLLKSHHLVYPAPPMQPSETHPLMIENFAASSLPLDPPGRMQQLFQKREQWTLEDLNPFLNDVAVDSKKRDAILLKYARTNVVKVAIPESKQERKARIKRGEFNEPTKNITMYSARLRYA